MFRSQVALGGRAKCRLSKLQRDLVPRPVFAAPPRRSRSTIGLSLRRGPDAPPLFDGTIPEHFASVVSAYGDRIAVTARSAIPATSTSKARETAYTYHELDLLSNRIASSLSSMGVRKGSHVAVSLGNGPEFAALTYGLFKLGAILVPLNPTFNTQQVASALNHLKADTLIIGAVTDLAYKPGRGRSNEEILRGVAGDLRGGKVESETVPSLANVIVVDNLSDHPQVNFELANLKAAVPYLVLQDGSDRSATPDSPLKPSDVINIQFTSGTTSSPKAAMLRHTAILNNGILIADRMGMIPSDRIVVPPPLFHCFGSVIGYMACATTGANLMFASPAFDPNATLKMCHEHDATGLYGVPTMLLAVLESLKEGDIPAPKSLRKGVVAGSSVPEVIMSNIQSELGLQDLVIGYGMTETSPISLMTSPSDPPHLRNTSVGTPMPHTSVKIVSPTDHSKVLPLNKKGELASAGYLTMEGYFEDPVKTAEVRILDEDGLAWIYSGDEAQMDEDGFVQITGRIKDLIIRGGENVHPLDVENCLFQLPGVRDVSVVAVPDDKLGESVGAFIIPEHGWSTNDMGDEGEAERCLSKEAVRAWVKAHLTGNVVPKHVFWATEFPKTASGKIQKFVLRNTAKEILGIKGYGHNRA